MDIAPVRILGSDVEHPFAVRPHQQDGDAELRVVERAELLFSLVCLPPVIGRLAELPAAAFAPPGLLSFAPPELLSALLSPSGLVAVRWGGAAVCLAAALLQRSIAVDLAACAAVCRLL